MKAQISSKQQQNTIDYEALYLLHFSKMKRFAKEYVVYEEDAENLVQDIFADLWDKKELLQTMTAVALVSYLYTTLKNRCLNFIRHKAVEAAAAEQIQEEYYTTLQLNINSLEALNSNVFDEEDMTCLVEKALNLLSGRCRKIFIMNKLEGKKQIAEELQISINTVETQMGIAYKKMRAALLKHHNLLLFLLC